jgi:hypothetical protein
MIFLQQVIKLLLLKSYNHHCLLGIRYEFNAFLLTYKLIPNVADPCIYYNAGSPPILTTLFVDDGIFCYVEANKRSATMQYMG